MKALIAFAGLDHLFRPLFIVSEKLLMNQSVITTNDCLLARIDIFRTLTLFMNTRSLSMIALKILFLSPALACDPFLYSVDFEDMLKDGESQEIVLDSMKNSIGYTGNSCCFEFKKYVKKNGSEFPDFHLTLTDLSNLSLDRSWWLRIRIRQLHHKPPHIRGLVM